MQRQLFRTTQNCDSWQTAHLYISQEQFLITLAIVIPMCFNLPDQIWLSNPDAIQMWINHQNVPYSLWCAFCHTDVHYDVRAVVTLTFLRTPDVFKDIYPNVYNSPCCASFIPLCFSQPKVCQSSQYALLLRKYASHLDMHLSSQIRWIIPLCPSPPKIRQLPRYGLVLPK